MWIKTNKLSKKQITLFSEAISEYCIYNNDIRYKYRYKNFSGNNDGKLKIVEIKNNCEYWFPKISFLSLDYKKMYHICG